MTSTAVEVRGASALAIRSEQSDWTPEQAQALLEMYNLGSAPEAVIRSYFHICQTTRLDPFKRQIHLIQRKGKYTPQTSIDGFRIIRDRSGLYDGDETFWCGPDGVWKDVWLDQDYPTAAKFVLYVKGRSKPVVAVALWQAYVGTKNDGGITSMWAKMGPHMLAKVAEALAIRKAFPDDTGGLYTDDEMSQADSGGGRQQRQASPGIMSLEEPPAPAPQQPRPEEAPIGGGFMDDTDSNIEDAVVVEDQTTTPEAAGVDLPAEQAEPVSQAQSAEIGAQEAAGEPLDMEPATQQTPEHHYYWSAKLAETVEATDFGLSTLRHLYDQCIEADGLSEPVPWIKLPDTDTALFHDAVMAIKDNLESGRKALEGLQ